MGLEVRMIVESVGHGRGVKLAESSKLLVTADHQVLMDLKMAVNRCELLTCRV